MLRSRDDSGCLNANWSGRRETQVPTREAVTHGPMGTRTVTCLLKWASSNSNSKQPPPAGCMLHGSGHMVLKMRKLAASEGLLIELGSSSDSEWFASSSVRSCQPSATDSRKRPFVEYGRCTFCLAAMRWHSFHNDSRRFITFKEP